MMLINFGRIPKCTISFQSEIAIDGRVPFYGLLNNNPPDPLTNTSLIDFHILIDIFWVTQKT